MRKYKYSINFRLEKRRSKPNNTESNVITEDVPILADITFGSKRIFFNVGYRIDSSKWINEIVDGVKIQQVKRNCFNLNNNSASDINARIEDIKKAVKIVFTKLELEEMTPTTNNVRSLLKETLNEDSSCTRKNLIECYNLYIKESTAEATWTKATITKHRTMIRHIESYKRNLYFEDITDDFLNGFTAHLINDCDLSNNYVAKMIKVFKSFLNWANRKGYNKLLSYKDYSPKLRGVSNSDKTNIIALSPKEFMHLYNLEIKKSYLDRVRDVFCFCCATSLRYSDVKNLKWSNVKNDCIELVTIKTNDPIVIYLNEISYPIIRKYEKYKGLIGNNNVLPVISNQRYNEYLKELGQLAGFDEPCTKVIFKGQRRIEITKPKYELITSHVARKTFVTLGLYKNIPAEIIRSFTGHKDAKVMERYFKFNNEEKKNQMKNFNFDDLVLKNVFDYNITSEECKILNIRNDKETYLKQIESDKDLAILHLALLFQERGDIEMAAEQIKKLPQDKVALFLQTTLNKL